MQSKLDPKQEFDKKNYVVSALNVAKKFGGHSALFIEGLDENEELFLRQYEIFFQEYDDQDSKVNIKGYISEIKVHYTYRPNDDFKSKSWVRPVALVRNMIDSIEKDKKKVDTIAHTWNQQIDKKVIDSEFIKEYGFFEYQLFGRNSIFSDRDDGDNCAGWVLEKLAIAKIGDGGAKPYPSKVAKGKVDSPCIII